MSLSCRAAVEKALRNVINSKEAEAARLRSEIIRLRHHLQLAADTQQQQQSNALVQEADTPSDPASRQAVLAAAVAAKDKPLAVVAQLERYVVWSLAFTPVPSKYADLSCLQETA